MPPEVEVCAIQFPGRENRLTESPFIRLLPLVKALAASIQTYLDRPFAFFGHSMGALIGFELACELRMRNNPAPVSLFVSSRRAPQLPNDDPPIHQLSDAKFIEELHQLNGTPDVLLKNDEFIQLILPYLRADFTLLETYVYTYRRPLDCPIIAFGGLQDNIVSEADLDAWKSQTINTFRMHMFPGDHFYLRNTQKSLLQEISRYLSQVFS